ncbi:MAG: 2-C-methyl-D-erythritol 4-phosphate cytidylyltransferase [Chryseolinea sp.]
MDPKEYALIVAGGKGTRIPGHTPKQFLVLGDRPMLMHTIEAFQKYSKHIQIILVLAAEEFGQWQALCAAYNFNKPLTLQQGGVSRFQSVKNGLSCIEEDGLVAIHDGARPLVTPGIIKASFDLARSGSSAVACVPLKESLRKIGGEDSFAVNRTDYRLIQTPQTFSVNLIRKAYEVAEDIDLTDDASVAERAGNKINLFQGSYENIKITTTEDVWLAEALLMARSTSQQ